jgi:uncharacterized protein YcaQ
VWPRPHRPVRHSPIIALPPPVKKADDGGRGAAKPKRFFEYWGHEASLLSIDCQPLLRWRMARALRDRGVWRQLEPFAGEKRGEAEALQSEMAFYG